MDTSQIIPASSTSTVTAPSTINSAPNQGSTRPRLTRRALTVVKVVKADVGNNGKPTNMHAHNMSVYINIYNEEQATVSHILQKIREEMGNDDLILVGPNGLIYHDQEGTRGTFCYVLTSNSNFMKHVSPNQLRTNLETFLIKVCLFCIASL